MNLRGSCILLLFSFSTLSLHAALIDLGTVSSFAVLGAETVTNTGNTLISGNLGVSPGTAITGFPPGVVINGTIHSADAVAAQAQTDALAAYNSLSGYGPVQDLTVLDLGGMTLTPGVYGFDTTAQLTGTLSLNMLGEPDSLFIFLIGTALTTASNSSVVPINGEDCCDVYWQIGSSATLGTGTEFRGNILALQSITLNTGATIADGRALALNGAVTLDTNNISYAFCDTGEVPEPRSMFLLGAGLFGLLLLGRTSRKRTG